MKVERVLHMNGGDGETSYASNSRVQVFASFCMSMAVYAIAALIHALHALTCMFLVFVRQEKAILKTRPVLHKAVAAAHALSSLSSSSTGAMVVDLGCSSGPNTLLFVSEVLGTVADQREEELAAAAGVGQHQAPSSRRTVQHHVQFFLNDLPGNDFNLVFQSLDMFRKLAVKEKGEALPQYYVAGLPGSFYTRLFPDRSVHLFHSSYSLMWRSKARTDLTNQHLSDEVTLPPA